MESRWPRNKTYNSGSRSELGHHTGYTLQRPQRRHRQGARWALNEETTPPSNLTILDPMGLMSPVLITGKLIFQDSRFRGVGCDELLPDDLGTRWSIWVKLPDLLDIHIPRWVGARGKENCQIHVFCDASERAYGTVLYIRSTHKTGTLVRIVCSKNRLAPLKKVTPPRLELIAALNGARLLHYFCKETGYDIAEATLWSDSTVALGWICNDPNMWKTSVANRVTEIQTYTTPSQWKHCRGQDNSADHLSRGVTAEQLKKLRNWWHGSLWL